MQWIIRTDLAEFFTGASPIVLAFGNTSLEVMRAGEENNHQRRKEIHESQCMMDFDFLSRLNPLNPLNPWLQNDRYIHQRNEDRRRHQEGSCCRGGNPERARNSA